MSTFTTSSAREEKVSLSNLIKKIQSPTFVQYVTSDYHRCSITSLTVNCGASGRSSDANIAVVMFYDVTNFADVILHSKLLNSEDLKKLIEYSIWMSHEDTAEYLNIQNIQRHLRVTFVHDRVVLQSKKT